MNLIVSSWKLKGKKNIGTRAWCISALAAMAASNGLNSTTGPEFLRIRIWMWNFARMIGIFRSQTDLQRCQKTHFQHQNIDFDVIDILCDDCSSTLTFKMCLPFASLILCQVQQKIEGECIITCLPMTTLCCLFR